MFNSSLNNVIRYLLSSKSRKYIKLGFRRRFLNVPASALSEMDVLIVSPGGVGTTFFINHVSKYCRVNCAGDRDGLKHLPRPPAGTNGLKVIFLDGNDDDIFFSLYRRGYLRPQLAKLGSIFGPVLPSSIGKVLLIRQVHKQRVAWSQLGSEKVLFVNYDDIWSKLPLLSKFLDLNETDFIEKFPERKERTSGR